jgi:hypothetical protein
MTNKTAPYITALKDGALRRREVNMSKKIKKTVSPSE